MTYTYVSLPVSAPAYDEIATKLRAAGYDHCFDLETIDMHGLALVREEPDRFECLLGSDVLPSQVWISRDKTVQLGAVVRRGFEETGMTVKQWNAMDPLLRDSILEYAVAVMQAEEAK
jgi:hypothetical protein